MIIFLIALGLLCLYGISIPFIKTKKPSDGNTYYKDYLSLDKTNAIKGIFIIIVFLSHSSQFVTMAPSLPDRAYDILIGTIIGQSMVSLFLLYSGYGVMLSIDKKGKNYIKSIPSKRVLKVLLHFGIAVVIFGLVQLALGKTFSIYEYLFSLIGWESLGNSNWYIFVILCLYFLTFIAFTIAKENKRLGLGMTFILSVLLLTAMIIFKGENYWYDTILCYPLGMAYYLFQEKIESFLFKNKVNWYIALAITAAGYIAAFMLRKYLPFTLLRHLLFGLTVVLFTQKVSINNKILRFFGKHLFSIYILQRLPMLVLQHFGFTNRYLFTIVTFVITILLAVPFDYLLGQLDKILFSNQNKLTKEKRS